MKKLVIIAMLAFCLVVNAQNRELEELQNILRASGASWTAGETSMSVLPVEEQMQLMGLLPGIYDLKNFPEETLDTTPVRALAFEAKHTPIKNQGQCGSCYAFGACATYESWKLVTTGKTTDLSEQWFMMAAKKIGPYGGCSGWYLDTSMNLLKNNGVCDESCCPYKASEAACPSTCQPVHKIAAWSSTTDKATIQNALQKYGLVYVGFAVYADFMTYTGGYYEYKTGALRGYHAVAVVGYDDTGWKVKNSWGTGWGESGYFKIKYNQMTNAVKFGNCFGGSFYITQ